MHVTLKAISTDRSVWASDVDLTDLHAAANTKYQAVADAHECTCCFCGFHSLHGMSVYHRDGNHSNNDLSNLALACDYCHAHQHLGALAKAGQLKLVLLDEIPQTEFNLLLRASRVGHQNTEDELYLSDIDAVTHFIKGRALLAKDYFQGEAPHHFLTSILPTLNKMLLPKIESALTNFRYVVEPDVCFSGESEPAALHQSWFIEECSFGRIAAEKWSDWIARVTL